jgi:hypothetical protein
LEIVIAPLDIGQMCRFHFNIPPLGVLKDEFLWGGILGSRVVSLFHNRSPRLAFIANLNRKILREAFSGISSITTRVQYNRFDLRALQEIDNHIFGIQRMNAVGQKCLAAPTKAADFAVGQRGFGLSIRLVRGKHLAGTPQSQVFFPGIGSPGRK